MDEDTPYDIAIARLDGHTLTPALRALLVGAIGAALRRHDVGAATLSVALVDDEHIATLNQTYRKHDGPTDVLTFDLRAAASGPIDGEIVVSVTTAARQTTRTSHDEEAELALYAVHGVLHLLDYDDHTQQAAQRMHVVEDEILTELGIGPVFRTTTR